MAHAPAPIVRFNLLDVIAKLRHARARIVQCVEWARATEEVWRAFNEGEHREAVAESPASQAAHVYERAARDVQILMITRVLDRTSREGALLSNRQSFPVCRDLLSLPGVAEHLIVEAGEWNNGLNEANGRRVAERLETFRDRLARLENEVEPNRLKLLRDFRDENIAHELHFVEQRDRPLYRHITEMLEEVKSLAEDLSFVAEGIVVVWDDTATAWRSGQALWSAVAERYPLDS